MAEQLPLQFEYRDDLSFATFFSGRNHEIISHLQACVNHTGESFIFIWGQPGLGKSHLLQACSQLAIGQNTSAFYLSFEPTQLPDPGILTGLEVMDLVCLDNIQHLIGLVHWELALFNFFNRMHDNNQRLIIASNCPPMQLPIQLADLQTRLSWGLTLKLQTLEDEELISALQTRAHSLGFEISSQSGRYLLNHYTREANALWALLERLDHATLAAQRKVTIPFLKQLLAL